MRFKEFLEGFKSSSKAEKETNVLGRKTNKYRQMKSVPTLRAVQNQENKIEKDLG
jgi:hypothetical protein